MEKDLLKKLIQDKFPEEYTNDQNLEMLVRQIEEASEDIRVAIENFLEGKDFADFQVEEFNVQTLKEGHGMNKIAALLTLDATRKDPERMLESLRKGHDTVSLK